MKSKFFLVIITAVFLNASLVQDYLNKKYSEICNIKNISKYEHNEKALSIIGVSCVKIDSLYLLPYIINKLKHTSYGRKNAVYFLTILMEKKLLYSFVYDGISLNSFSFPMTDYVLSEIFEAVKNHKYIKKDGVYIIKTGNKTVFKMYTRGDKMFIDEYKNNKLIKRRWYR